MEPLDFIGALRRRKWVVISSGVLVALAALLASAIQPQQYAAVAHVQVAEQGTHAPGVFDKSLAAPSAQPERALQTEIQLMKQRPIAEATVRRLGLRMTASELMKHLTVIQIGQTAIVKVVATDPSPRMAAMIANSIAREYVQRSRLARRKTLESAVTAVQKRMSALAAEIDVLKEREGDKKRARVLADQLRVTQDAYAALGERLEQLKLETELETGAGKVVMLAIPDADQVSPRPLRIGAVGLVVGLALGVLAALFLPRRDVSARSVRPK